MKMTINSGLYPEHTYEAFFEHFKIDHMDIVALESAAHNRLIDLGVRTLELQVKGFSTTTQLVAILNACKKLDIPVTLYHERYMCDPIIQEVL